MSRYRWLAGVVGGLVMVASLSWLVASAIRSPAEIAAAAQPPPASNITVEVVRQVLSADVIVRGDIVYNEALEVSLSGSFAEQPEKLIVTLSVGKDARLAEGDIVVEVVGRPVFLMMGEIPMYRDMRSGASGDDVQQLEEALARLGFLAVPPDDSWGEETGAAVAALFESAGYRAQGLSEDDEAALRAARDRVHTAETSVSDAEKALVDARKGTAKSVILAAEGEVAAARDALDLALLDAGWANGDAGAALNEAESALATANESLEEALSADPPPAADELAGLEQAVSDAEAALTAAQRNVDRVAIEQASLVAQAENRLAVAQTFLAELQEGTDVTSLRRQLAAAEVELDAARADLASLNSKLGTWVPAGELIFLRRLPVRVDKVLVSRGSEIIGPFVAVSGSELAVIASIPEEAAAEVEVGMAVQVENPETGGSIPGTISLVAERPGTDGVPADRVYLEVEPGEIPEELIGENVRLTIPVSSTGGAVLAVPAAALFATADGSTLVEVEDPQGSLRTVRVRTGLATGGLVEVTPLEGELSEGDLVVVGRADGSTPGEEESRNGERDAP